jgi:hypothetical protein
MFYVGDKHESCVLMCHRSEACACSVADVRSLYTHGGVAASLPEREALFQPLTTHEPLDSITQHPRPNATSRFAVPPLYGTDVTCLILGVRIHYPFAAVLSNTLFNMFMQYHPLALNVVVYMPKCDISFRRLFVDPFLF